MVSSKQFGAIVLLGLSATTLAAPAPGFVDGLKSAVDNVGSKATSVAGAVAAKVTGAADDKGGKFDMMKSVLSFIDGNNQCSSVVSTVVHFGVDAITSSVKSYGDIPIAVAKELISCYDVVPQDDKSGHAVGAKFQAGLNVPYQVDKHDVGKAICNEIDAQLGKQLTTKHTDFTCAGQGCTTTLSFVVQGDKALTDPTVNKILNIAALVEEKLIGGCAA